MMMEVTSIESFVPVLVSGADARTFMQGQLTADLKKVSPTQAVFGACCNAQGRVQTLVAVFERDESLVLLVQSALAERVLARFLATRLSSKVEFERPSWVIAAIFGGGGVGALHDLPDGPGECKTVGDLTWLRFWGADERYLLVAPAGGVRVVPANASELSLAWQQSDVMSGLPWIHAATQNSFVPQTINLDLLGGISFEKGCYVGQEVVARARRSGVPRRMFGFSADCPPPAPGTEVLSSGAVAGEVVSAVALGAGSRLLATVDLERASTPLSLKDVVGSELTPAPLPYAVPLERPAPIGLRVRS